MSRYASGEAVCCIMSALLIAILHRPSRPFTRPLEAKIVASILKIMMSPIFADNAIIFSGSPASPGSPDGPEERTPYSSGSKTPRSKKPFEMTEVSRN